jgi:DNA-binding winged helix-turn-helix (wHTH) protein/tetratricopeptide (TPR) repeat protein
MFLQKGQLYRFDQFEMQPSRRALLRGGERIAVAPKSFEVLLCLVQNSGRVVLKEEILEAVWPGAFVEEGNLTQHIFWLRKALGDRSTYIVTVPGRGYEFTGQVESAPEDATRGQRPSHAGATLRFAIEETVERTQIVVEEGVPPEPQTRTAKWRSGPRLLTASVCLAAVGVVGGWLYTHRVVAGDHHEVVLADFENTTHDADFDRSLKTLLAIDLNQSPFLLVVGENDTRKVMKLMNLPADATVTPAVAREVCERLNDQVVLAGRLAQVGQKYLVTLDATDCADGRSLAQTRGIADSREGVIKAVDAASAEMRRKLGEPLRSAAGSEAPLPLKHTFSLDALKAYSQARALHQRLKFAQAVPLYQKAIELDPNFADAYAQLGNCFNNMGEALEGRKAMARAYELRDQADEQDRLRIVSMYEYWRTGDRHEAIRNYQKWTRLYPLATNPWVLLGEFQASVGRMDLAVDAAKHAVANNPNSVSSRQDLAQWQRYDGQLDAARATCLDALRHGLESASIHRTLLDVAYLQHNAAEFEEQRVWFRDKAEEDDREGMEADFDGSQGRMRSAVAHWEHLADLQSKDGLKEAALEAFSGVPDMEADFGMTKEAKAHLQRYEAPVPLVGASLTSVIMAAAEVGNLPLAERKLKYMLDNGKEDSDVQELFAPESRAAIAIASGKGDQAVAAMQPSLPYELTDPSAAMMRGAAYLAARQPELAQKEFQLIIDRPFISGISPNVAMAHLSLARALVMEGNRDAAKQEYKAFLEMMRDADADLPVVSQARRESLSIP